IVLLLFHSLATLDFYTLSLHDALPICLSKLSYNEVIEYMENFAEMSLLKVGVSRIMSAHIYLHYQYIQAQIALSLGMEKWPDRRSEEHTSELQSRENLVCRLLLEKKKK